MIDHPLFVPHGDEHLAALLTMPEGEPAGLVVLLTGIGAPRSHRFQMWTVLARRLADVGLASIRFDYHGMGDSTGNAFAWGPDWTDFVPGEVLTVAREGLRVSGTDRVAVVGNCAGAELALRMAAEMPECVGALCILLAVLEKSKVTAMRRRLGSSRFVKALRRMRATARLLARFVRGRRPERHMQSEMLDLVQRTLGHSSVLCVYGEHDKEYNRRVHEALERTARGVRGLRRGRFAVRVLPGIELGGFEAQSLQDITIDITTEWMAATFGVTSHRTGVPVAAGRSEP
jgi:pimeloyl-ACP methyl ester carboxylesterase